MFTVSCQGQVLEFSGLESAIGKSAGSGMGTVTDGNFLAFALLLLPAAIFIVIQFRNKSSALERNSFTASLLLSAAGVVMMIIYQLIVNNKVAQSSANMGFFNTNTQVFDVNFTVEYWLSILLYILILIMSLFAKRANAQKY